MNFKTIILRFRDLSIADGETISLHKTIIEEKGDVWWGWWKKPLEKTPIENFGALNSIAANDTLEILLVDSGQHKLYKAVCSEIKSYRDKVQSPDADKTPSYYNSERYTAWFKFSSIDECDNDYLKQFTYVNVDNLFEANEADYSSFENKVINSIDELVQQERTVWFIRDRLDTDLDYKIVLLNSEHVQPTHFSERYHQSCGDSFLWLSDLHLADTSFCFEKKPTSKTLSSHIQDVVKKTNNTIAGLIITGDITSGAQKIGFDRGLQLLKDLGSCYSLNSENIAMCPGNHDFSYHKNDLNNDEQPCALLPEYAIAYSDFYKMIYKINPNSFFASGKKILLSSGITVDIACLNSLYLQQYPNFRGHGYISEEQLSYVKKEMGWDNRQTENTIRIAIMHHHYLPTCKVEKIDIKKPSSVVYDANRLMGWLIENDVKVLLHGHKHTSFHAYLNYPSKNQDENNKRKGIAVLGLGSTAYKNSKNVVAVVKILRDGLKIQLFELHSEGTEDDNLIQEFCLPLGVSI